MQRRVTNFLCAAVLVVTTGSFDCAFAGNNVRINDVGTHYDVWIDYEHGATPRQIGEEYGEQLLAACPQFESIFDSYIAENTQGSWLIYKVMLSRVKKIRKQLQPQYREEIEGIASKLSGGDDNKQGDGKLSADELFTLNFMADIARMNQCSAVAAFGKSTPFGNTICGRNLDWPDGKANQLSRLQSITTIRRGRQSTVNIACLGYMGAVTAFNASGVYGAILDSPTGRKYSASGKRSYSMDLRQALEQFTTIEQVAAFMGDEQKDYPFNHLIFLADPVRAAVLENNISGFSANRQRALRTVSSPLRGNARWVIDDAIGTVNCFCLAGNDDNHLDPSDWDRVKAAQKKGEKPVRCDINTPRWLQMQQQLQMVGPTITSTGIKQVMSEHHGRMPGSLYDGDLYNAYTIQSVIFEPQSFTLEVFFRPRDGKLPAMPQYEPIPVRW